MVVATRAGAEQEKQPGGLQVFEVWKALEQEVVLVPGLQALTVAAPSKTEEERAVALQQRQCQF